MSTRRRRQFYLSPEYYGRKYIKKPRRNMVKDPVSSSGIETVEDHEPGLNASGTSIAQVPDNHRNVNETVTLNVEPTDSESESEHSDSSSENTTMHVPNNHCNLNEMVILSDEPTDSESEHSEDTDDEFLDETSDLPMIFSNLKKKTFTTVSGLKVEDILFMVLNYYVRHSITQTAVEDMLKMLNTISGIKLFPESFSSFMANFQSNPYNSVRVFYCINCQYDYGTTSPETEAECPICGSRGKDFFISIPVEPQIRELVIEHKIKIENYAQHVEKHEIADVNRGDFVRKKCLLESRECLTLSANTDGAATFKSTTQKPLYPLFVTLNNLPPNVRYSKHNLIVSALWLSKGEPNTNLLFKYFCLELQRLEDTGIDIDGKTYSVSLLQVNLDSVARCKVQNMKQYNGVYGCTYCLHPGETKNSNNSRCYPNMDNIRKREDKPTRQLMEEVSTTGIEKLGVMGKSVFTFLPDFDMIDCFPPDYMHSILLGVMKQLWSLWTESENHKQPFYIGTRLGEIEKRMMSFRPPSVFPRYPRQLKEYKKYKANEWEAVLLHYVYPAVINILPKQFLDHVMLLSSSIHQLLDPKLNESTVNSCELNLNMFLQQFEILYGKNNMSYNVHLTGHIIEAVRNFGALYNFSLFPYESGNGMLLGFRTGTKSPIVQIERKYYLNKLCHLNYRDFKSPVKNWVHSIWSKQQSSVQYDPRVLYVLKDNLMFDADVVERSFSAHGKMYSNGLNLCTKQACKAHKYDDSWVHMNDNFYSIEEILCDQNNIVYIVGQQLLSNKLWHHVYSYELTDIIKVMRINDTIRQCIHMSIKINDRSLKLISTCKIRTYVD